MRASDLYTVSVVDGGGGERGVWQLADSGGVVRI